MTTTEDQRLEDELEAIRPVKEDWREQALGLGEEREVYVQKPLSFFGKMTLTKVLGQALSKAMSEGGGTALASLFGTTPEELEAATKGDAKAEDVIDWKKLQETAMMIQAVGVLMEYAPSILEDIYVLALSVPSGEQEWAREQMRKAGDEGGLSDDDGFAILDTFIEQNAEALKAFFADHLLPMVRRFRVSDSATQPPSRATRRATQRRSKSSSTGRGKDSS